MFGRAIKYHRLKAGMSKTKLAEAASLTPAVISYYENNKRNPSMEALKAIAAALGVNVTDFIMREPKLTFQHAEFRKLSTLSVASQDAIKNDVEDFFTRFYDVVTILGPKVLPNAPKLHVLELSSDDEENAARLREHLGFPESGPIGSLIESLENKGILVYEFTENQSGFSGINGLVCDRPYIAVNVAHSIQRVRSTIVHELAHLMFEWPKEMEAADVEKKATAISGMFLFPKADAIRELGIRRTRITKDMMLISKEYGISIFLLVKRAEQCKIINRNQEKSFNIKASSAGWKRNDPSECNVSEKGTLFKQLVYRAINEETISIQKGVELLKKPYEEIRNECFFREA